MNIEVVTGVKSERFCEVGVIGIYIPIKNRKLFVSDFYTYIRKIFIA